MPWRAGGTLWKIEVWHGSVTEGTTLCARIVAAARARRARRLGQRAASIASGRRPSIRMKTTGIESSIVYMLFRLACGMVSYAQHKEEHHAITVSRDGSIP